MRSRPSLRDIRDTREMPATPSPAPQPASAPTSRLRKRNSAGRPLTALNNPRGGIRTLGSTPESKLNESEKIVTGQRPSQGSEQPFSQEPLNFEYKGAENTPPNWLKRMSTLSSLKAGSLDATTRPDSPSIAYSNGSSVPFLPASAGQSPATISRNKLVKRSTSQHALYGSNALHSTLRRPATSHQRSATLQQFQQDEQPSRPSLAASSILPHEILESHHTFDEPPQLWEPFFTPQANGTKDGISRKRSANGIAVRNNTVKTIVPEVTEVATLLLATSINPSLPNETARSRMSNISSLSRPFTPMDLHNSSYPRTTRPTPNATDDNPDLKSRNSFSLSEIFPSPSPSSWKLPRTSSVRRNKILKRDEGDSRRVVSAPQSTNTQNPVRLQAQSNSERKSISRHDVERRTSPPCTVPGPSHDNEIGSSSPLPPLNRLSTFEINIPENIPSYPVTPEPEISASSPRDPSIHSAHSAPSPLGPLVSKTRPYRFSSAPSEPGSTLLGSDNDNSRLLSGDEDDIDSRSETVYDSTRTGATGSSQSGVRRTPIDTIFDESPPPQLPLRKKSIDLQDLLDDDTPFVLANRHDLHLEESEHEVFTPVIEKDRCKEHDSPTPMHNTSEILYSPRLPSSSPPVPLQPSTMGQVIQNRSHEEDEDLWSFENAAISTANHVRIRKVSLSSGSSALLGSRPQTSEELPRNHETLSPAEPNKSLKSNIFEWSEQTLQDKESSPGHSPRPKTVHGRQGKDVHGSHPSGRRSTNALHLRSQSVPVHKDMASRRSHNNPSKLDSWVLGNKKPSEDWDGDFEFEEPPRPARQASSSGEPIRLSHSSGMLVPRTILERQASFHGQFGQVKELTLLVEELKRLEQQAASLGIMEGQSAELWKEAEGIINLATLDDEEREIFPPHSPNFDFDPFDEDSPSIRSRRRSGLSPPKEDRTSEMDEFPSLQASTRPSQDKSGFETPPPPSRPRKESSAKAKSVLETIQRGHYDPALLDAPFAQKKLPFDTTSLKDLVTRAGVVLRALKEIVRQASGPVTPEPPSLTTRELPYISQMFQRPPVSPTISKSPRVTQSSQTPKSQRSGTFRGGSITSNDNEINGHMKMMTVV